MGEFGHFGKVMPGLCIDTWGAGPFVMIHIPDEITARIQTEIRLRMEAFSALNAQNPPPPVKGDGAK